MSLALASRRAAISPAWVKNPLWRTARAVPSLDLPFADTKSLVDAVTGQSLVTFTRASSGTCVGSDGVLRTAAVNEPRFDHNPTTGESLGLLVEEQRTNLVVQSEDFGTTWTTTGLLAFGSGSTLNATTAPTGALTADLITEDTSSGNHRIATAAISWVGNTQYTFSCFVKANGRSNISFLLGTAGNWVNSSREAQFNLSTGTVSYTSGTPVTASITAFPSGWYRLTMTATTVAAPSASSVFIQMMDSTPVASYTGNGTSGVFLFGAQLEAGAFPTSYIPTTTAAATRSADVASITGTAFSSWYRQDEGTVFAGLVTTSRGYSAYPRLVGIFGSNIDVSNEFAIYTRNIGTADDYKMYGIVTDGSVAGDFNPPASTPVGSGRVALSAKQNDGAFTVNGLTPVTDNTLNMPTSATQLLLFSNARYQPRTSGTIRRLTYWPQRLPNSTIQAITQ